MEILLAIVVASAVIFFGALISMGNERQRKAIDGLREQVVLEMFDEPQSLICVSGDGSVKVIFSPLSPANLRRIKNGKQNRLSQFGEHNPLLLLPKNVNIHELSILNGGHLFDLELAIAWKDITQQNLESSNQLWIYEWSLFR